MTNTITCSIEGCEKMARTRRRGLCSGHLGQEARGVPLSPLRPIAPRSAPGTTCSIPDCGKPLQSHGMCSPHYMRARKHGDPLGGGPSRRDSLDAALREHSQRDGECISWTGDKDRSGYGRVSVNGKSMATHRVAWERERGPIPDGLFMDHACHNRACMNVEHLRLANRYENSQNRSGPDGSRKNQLPRGVSPHRRKFKAVVEHRGVAHYLGLFDTPEGASAAAASKRAELFGEFAGGA